MYNTSSILNLGYKALLRAAEALSRMAEECKTTKVVECKNEGG